MWLTRQTHRITGIHLALVIALALLPVASRAAEQSPLSRWLSREIIPEIQTLLSQHPRYAGQRVRVVSGDANALSETIATLLRNTLAQREGVRLVAPQPTSVPYHAHVASVDELDCQAAPDLDYLLQVSLTRGAAGKDGVQILLLDARAEHEQSQGWQWLGTLGRDERAYRDNPGVPAAVNGSLDAPWTERDVNAAAAALSRDLACALRPQIKTRLGLQWPQHSTLPALFADTVNTSQHMLGNYREIGMTAVEAAYTVEFRLERFRHDTWQLWLIGTPRSSDFAPVQAVTYFRVGEPGEPAPAVVAALVRPVRVPPAELGPALDHIDIEVLDATQSDRGHSRAELQVTLRIGNRADWPIEYAFTLSGGHFNHCIARPDYYRHDGYGRLNGTIEPGASVVRRLIIADTRHQPTPWFGVRKCAGFRDLEGFEEFASQGHKVTDFVRWDL